MKKLKNMMAVIVCLSVMLTVPAYADLTSNQSTWLNSIYQDIGLLRSYFNSTSLGNNPIAYYVIQIEDELETFHGTAKSFYQQFNTGGRIDDYFFSWTQLLGNISNAMNSSYGNNLTLHDLFYNFLMFYQNIIPMIGQDISLVKTNIISLLNDFNQAFDASTHGSSKDIYSMLYEAYQDIIVPAEETDKTVYELLYDMHTELGGYEEGSYGLTLYGTLDEQLKLLKLREPIWEFELEEFLKNKDNYDQIEHIFTNGQDTDTSLGMGSIRALGDLLSTANSDLKSVGSVDDFITNWEAVNADGDEWFSTETQNALDTVPSVVLFSDDEDPYNMNAYMERWGVLTDVIR